MAIASTGAFSPMELAWMVVPLIASALAEATSTDLTRHRLKLELSALTLFLAMIFLQIGLVAISVNLLFQLCAIRLSMRRNPMQKRQVMLMAFLLYLVTCISTPGISFIFWSLLWIPVSAFAFASQNWEETKGESKQTLHLDKKTLYPFVRLTLAVVAFSSLLFILLPRHRATLGRFWRGAQNHAGLSESIDLAGSGAITLSGEKVLRVVPLRGNQAAIAETFSMLRAFALERYQDGRWEIDTPAFYPKRHRDALPQQDYPLAASLNLEPGETDILPMPYGAVRLSHPRFVFLENNPGDSLRWHAPFHQSSNITIEVNPGKALEIPLETEITQTLLEGGDSKAPGKWSRKVAPGALPAAKLAQKLERELRSFDYTLNNPSGMAKDPIRDFLERTRAGHCEYFASAMALALRQRGVPARVVSGYRLGTWNQAGGYWMVTQDEAHSWVEYLDDSMNVWRVSDPTPGLLMGRQRKQGLWTNIRLHTDALRFRWEQYVLRFSQQNQQAGLAWIRSQISKLPELRVKQPSIKQLGMWGILAAVMIVGAVLLHRRKKGSKKKKILPSLTPLLRATRKTCPVQPGETVQAWCQRLATARPDLESDLKHLAEQSDKVAYGNGDNIHLMLLVQRLKKAYRRGGAS